MEQATELERRRQAAKTTTTSGLARANRFAVAIMFSLALAFVFAAYVGAGIGEQPGPTPSAAVEVEGPRLGGDYAAFYGAGSIVWNGDIDSLYDPAVQTAAQVGLGLDGFLAFAYPPHVAVVYAPLGALPFQVSWLIHTLFMAATLIATVVVLAPVVPLIQRNKLPLMAAGLTFYPLLVAVGGGQNAPLTVLGFAIIWRALHDDREWLAGLIAGLMMYRPQYALAAMGLMLLSRHWRAVATAVVTSALTWTVTALFLGADWVGQWLDAVIPFVEEDAVVNADNSISAIGFMQAIWPNESDFAVGIGVAIAVVVVLTLMFLWVQPDRFTLADRMGSLAIGSVLISPHTQFYDASTLLIAGAAVLAATDRDAVPVKFFALVWLVTLIHRTAEPIGATPLALVVVASFFAMVVATIKRPGSQEPVTALPIDSPNQNMAA